MKIRNLLKLQVTVLTVLIGLGVVGIVNASRDSSGNYTLPATTVTPAITGQVIDADDFNTVLDDIATEMTDSLSRSGDGAMLGQFKAEGGTDTAASPGITFDGDLDTGIYHQAANQMGIAAGGVKVGEITSTTTSLPGLFTAGGRLTLTTAVPVTASGVTGATTVYYTPYLHNLVTVYDGTNWVTHTFSELSQATTDSTKSPAAVANDSNYDIFVWNDSGTLRATRGPAWSSATSRGTGAGTTELERFEGRYVNKIAITNGPAARRGLYVGSIRSNGTASIDDSQAFRHVWNMHNRVQRGASVGDTTDSWTYSTATWRQANNNSANQITYIAGLDEDTMDITVMSVVTSDTVGGNAQVGIGYDSTTTPTNSLSQMAFSNNTANIAKPAAARTLGANTGTGFHTLAWLERGYGSGTQIWYGDGGGITQSGIMAVFRM